MLDNGFSPAGAPEGSGLALRPASPIDADLPTMAAAPPLDHVLEPAAREGSVPAAVGAPDVPVDVTLVMAPARGGSTADARSAGPAASVEPEALGLPAASSQPDASEWLDATPRRRSVWPTVLADLLLLGAVAGAAAVYLLLQR